MTDVDQLQHEISSGISDKILYKLAEELSDMLLDILPKSLYPDSAIASALIKTILVSHLRWGQRILLDQNINVVDDLSKLHEIHDTYQKQLIQVFMNMLHDCVSKYNGDTSVIDNRSVCYITQDDKGAVNITRKSVKDVKEKM